MTAPGTLRSRMGWQAVYGFLLALMAASVTLSLLLSRAYFGWYERPPFFQLFRVLDYLQLGLLGALFTVTLEVISGRRRHALLRTLVLLPAVVFTGWLVVWATVYRAFGIRLSPDQVWELLAEPRTIQLVGLAKGQVLLTVVLILGGGTGLAVALQAAARRSGERFARGALVGLLAGTLLVHLSVRSYLGYHIAHNQRAALVLDEVTPLALRTESLIPGVGRGRVQFQSLADPARNQAYLTWVRRLPTPLMPRKESILWISVESLRADAVSDSTTPYLYAHRDEYQLQLGDDYWSGGNATKLGIFSMLTGLAAYQMPAFRREGLHFPLLSLLVANGYRLRMAKGLSWYYGNLRAFLPAGAILPEVRGRSRPGTDHVMVDSLLADLDRRGGEPAFDFLTFDATHWPYEDPVAYLNRAPDPSPEWKIYRGATPPEVLRTSKHRYRNSVRFVDSEIGRVVERLRASGALRRTVVIVTGDHGEEFLERGQIGHSSGMNDFQGEVPLWIHFPDHVVPVAPTGLGTNLDIVPTLLEYLGFPEDVLRTQGRSLLHSHPPRSMLMLAEQGWSEPTYHALVTERYVSRWRVSGNLFLFSSVERRDGKPVAGMDWWGEVEAGRPAAAREYEVLPDTVGPRPFADPR